MKKVHVLLYLLLLCGVAVAQQKVSVSGKIADARTDTVRVMIFENLISHKKTVNVGQVDEEGVFSCSFTLSKPHWVYLNYDHRFRRMYLTPGDELSAVFDSSRVNFSGKGATVNNFLHSYDEKFESQAFYTGVHEKMKLLLPADYKKYQDGLKKEKLDMLHNCPDFGTFSPAFINFMYSEIEYAYASALIDYPEDHAYLTQNKTGVALPADYYNFLSKIKILNEDALEQASVAYFNFLRYDYVTYEATRQARDFKHDDVHYFAQQYDFVKKDVKTFKDRILYFTLASILYSCLNYGDVSTIETSYADFIASNPYSEYSSLVKEAYTAKKK